MVDYFISNKEKYHFNAVIGDDAKSYPLILENTGLFEYSNEMNTLYTKGSIEYSDTNGIIDRITEMQVSYLTVSFSHAKQESDGDIAPVKIDNRIDLKFFVDNIEILENVPGMIKYKIYLVSVNYKNLHYNARYTNYGKNKESPTDILNVIIVENGKLKTNSKLFEANKSKSQVDYITNENDDILTAQKHLMNKTFYFPQGTQDDSIKALVYDDAHDIVNLIDLKRSGGRLGIFPPVTINVLKNDTDFTNEEPTNIGYMARNSKIKGKLNLKAIKHYTYDIESNSFDNPITQSQTIVNYYNGGEGGSKICVGEDDEKTDEHQTAWNNSLQMYEEAFETLTQTNGLIINQYGWIGTIPGYQCQVSIPNNFPLDSQDKNDNDFERSKYQQFTGTWDVFKVQHFINPSKSVFRQKLVLFRTA